MIDEAVGPKNDFYIKLTNEAAMPTVLSAFYNEEGEFVSNTADYAIDVIGTLSEATGVTLTDANGNTLTLSSGPNHVGSTLGSSDGELQANETATYIAFYVIGQTAVDNAGISNTVTATGSSPGNTDNVTDVSDDGDDTDGNNSNDPTVVTTTELDPSIEVTKTATITDNGDGITGLEDVINLSLIHI